MALLDRIKARLSRVSTQSWHYTLAEAIWGSSNLHRSKACSYYWLKVPSALLLFVVAIFVSAIMVGVQRFFGFHSTLLSREDGPDHYPYKMSPSGRRKRFAPWEFVAYAGGLWAIYYFSMVNRAVGLVVLASLAGLLVLAAFIYAISSSWRSPFIAARRNKVKAAWDKVCPALTVIDSDQA